VPSCSLIGTLLSSYLHPPTQTVTRQSIDPSIHPHFVLIHVQLSRAKSHSKINQHTCTTGRQADRGRYERKDDMHAMQHMDQSIRRRKRIERMDGWIIRQAGKPGCRPREEKTPSLSLSHTHTYLSLCRFVGRVGPLHSLRPSINSSHLACLSLSCVFLPCPALPASPSLLSSHHSFVKCLAVCSSLSMHWQKTQSRWCVAWPADDTHTHTHTHMHDTNQQTSGPIPPLQTMVGVAVIPHVMRLCPHQSLPPSWMCTARPGPVNRQGTCWRVQV